MNNEGKYITEGSKTYNNIKTKYETTLPQTQDVLNASTLYLSKFCYT